MFGPTEPSEYNEGTPGPLNDADLEAQGKAAGLDVWEPLTKAYIAWLDGHNNLANAQLWSLREAIRAEYAAELVAGLPRPN